MKINLGKIKLKGFSLLVTVLFLASVILLNILAGMLTERFFLKADLTDTGLYTLSERAEEFLNDIDEIVRLVRFPDWQSTTTGERIVRKELRKVLYVKYKIQDQELFDKAYNYIKVYY